MKSYAELKKNNELLKEINQYMVNKPVSKVENYVVVGILCFFVISFIFWCIYG